MSKKNKTNEKQVLQELQKIQKSFTDQPKGSLPIAPNTVVPSDLHRHMGADLIYDTTKRLLFDTLALLRLEVSKIVKQSLLSEEPMDSKSLKTIVEVFRMLPKTMDVSRMSAFYEKEVDEMSPQELRKQCIGLLKTYGFIDDNDNPNIPSEEEFLQIWDEKKEEETQVRKEFSNAVMSSAKEVNVSDFETYSENDDLDLSFIGTDDD